MTDELPTAAHTIAEFERDAGTGAGLRGYRSGCGYVTVTWGLVCPRCGEKDLSERPLSGRGRIAALTVQTVPSDQFVQDAPYAYVVVDLEEGGRMTGWMPTVRAVGALQIGDAVRWVPSERAGIVFERAEPSPGSSP